MYDYLVKRFVRFLGSVGLEGLLNLYAPGDEDFEAQLRSFISKNISGFMCDLTDDEWPIIHKDSRKFESGVFDKIKKGGSMSTELIVPNSDGVISDLVYDEDSGEDVAVTMDMRQRAQFVRDKKTETKLIDAILLKIVRDEKLYLVEGYGSMKEYWEMEDDRSTRTMEYLLRGADRFVESFPHLIEPQNGQNDQMSLVKSNKNTNPNSGSVVDLFAKHFTGLSRISDTDYEDVSRDPETMFDKYQDLKLKFQREQEKRKLAQSESKSKDKALHEKDKRIYVLTEEKAAYGALPTFVENKRERMDAARKHLYYFEQMAFGVNVDKDDPTGLKKDMADFIRRVHESWGRLAAQYAFVDDELEDNYDV